MSTESLRIGQKVMISRIVNEVDIEAFAKLSLDRNPVHFDEDFAAKTIFGRRIAHGMIGMALISGALTELMGNGNVWLSATIKFEKPVFIGDELSCTLTITELKRRGIATIEAVINKASGEVVISGTLQSMRFVNNPYAS